MGDLPRAFGPYTLLKSLGAGGAGDVFLARPRAKNMPSPLVIKRLHGQLAAEEEYVRRFAHEAQLAVHIQDPHVVKVYDVGRVGDSMYIAMEYVPGWTVARLMSDLREARQQASLASVGDIVGGALEGLAALHGAVDPATGRKLGIIHRDLAPKNIMVGEDGVARLIDLGLGKSTLQDWRTETGVVLGSPGYMAPEQVTAEAIDQRTDLYVMGILLWEFLTLERYIKRGPIAVMLRASVAPPFVPPSQLRPEVGKALDEVCAQALAPARERRFQSARDFRQALIAAIPTRRDDSPMATLIGAMLWGELGQAKTEITQLMARSQPVEEPEQPAVQILATRPGLDQTKPLWSDPELSVPPAPGETPPAPVLPLVTPLGARVQASLLAPPEVQPTPPALTQSLRPPSGGVPVRVVALLILVVLGVGIGLGRYLMRGPAPQEAPLDAPRVETALERPTVSVTARPVAVEPSPEQEKPAVTAPRAARREEVRREERPLVLRPEPAPRPLAPEERVRALVKRVRDRLTVASGVEKERLEALLARLVRESAALAQDGAEARIEAMERELERPGG